MSVWWMGSEFTARLVDTDYDTFSLTYMCHNLKDNKKIEKWGVNIRDPDASEAEKSRIMEHVKTKLKESQGETETGEFYSFEDLVEVKQGRSVCQYYGEKASGGE